MSAQRLYLERIKIVIRRNRLLHRWVMYARSTPLRRRVVDRNRTRLVIEAFPRSASGFALALVDHTNPQLDRSQIVHHTHSIHTVMDAVKWSVPALVLLRNPIDCIASFLTARGFTDTEMAGLAIELYRDFYDPLARKLDQIEMVRFEELTRGEFQQILERVNQKFNTRFQTEFDEHTAMEAASHQLRTKALNKNDPARSPHPHPGRSVLLDRQRQRVASHPEIESALGLYRDLVAGLP